MSLLKLILITHLLFPANFAKDQTKKIKIKTSFDLAQNNHQLKLFNVKTLFTNRLVLCIYRCDEETNGDANLRRYNPRSLKCDCIIVQGDLNAPQTHGVQKIESIYIVDIDLLTKPVINVIEELPLDYPPLVPCNTTEDIVCDCNYNYMVANYKGENFCMFMYFNPAGDETSFPVCNDPCCQTTCNWIQPVAGNSSSVATGKGVDLLWDGTASQKNGYCFLSKLTTGIHSVTLFLGQTVSINAVTILAQDNYPERLNNCEVKICGKELEDCSYCGTFLNADMRWNHLRCEKEFSGAWIIGEQFHPTQREKLDFCEILVHYRVT